MELNKETIKKLQGLILFTAFVVVLLVNYKSVFQVLKVGFNIIFPFILGAVLAFIINAPMQFFERHLFKNEKMTNKKAAQKIARPASLLIALLAIIAVIMIVIFVVVPELGKTFASLGKTISEFIPVLQDQINHLFKNENFITQWVDNLDLQKTINTAVDFLKNGVGDVLNSTYTIAKSVVNGLTTFFISFVFACYIVLQKEKLEVQIKKVFYAFFKEKTVKKILSVCSLAYHTFLNFLTGQCVEAVILGSMFFVAMSIFRFPYALLVGVLIAFTALIPIFGAFIGCAVGAFLLLMVDPVKAVAFVVMFLVLQQVEGNFIYPHVVGNSVGLPSIWVLVAVSLGGSLMGVAGMLIFIPATSVVYKLFRGYVYKRLHDKQIDETTITS
ncbi:MAG: AI-2E family transporter [Eubacteriales bacterium]|nr:AI-2E family transporter [Eubacteriales bacterium]